IDGLMTPPSPYDGDTPQLRWGGKEVELRWSFRCRRLRDRLEVGRIVEMDRRVGLERALEVEALGDLADRREDLLAHQPDAGERILLADPSVIAPQRQDAGPRRLEDALQLGHHRVGRTVDDAQVVDLL